MTHDSSLTNRLQSVHLRWERIDTVSPLPSETTSTEHALSLFETVWGKTELSDMFCELFNTRGNTMYDRTIKDHFTGSVILIDPTTRNILMTKHPRSGMWQQLGGHDEGEHDPFLVAAREAREESGMNDIWVCDCPVRIDPHEAKGGCRTVPGEFCMHYDMCFMAIASHDRFVQSEESSDMRWFSLDEIAQLVAGDHAQQRALEMAQNALILLDALVKQKRVPEFYA